MNAPTHQVVLQGATSQLTEVRDVLARHDIRAEILQPPGSKLNG